MGIRVGSGAGALRQTRSYVVETFPDGSVKIAFAERCVRKVEQLLGHGEETKASARVGRLLCQRKALSGRPSELIRAIVALF
jgi:hypothetical protein